MKRVSLLDPDDLAPMKIFNSLTFHALDERQHDVLIQSGGHEFSSFSYLFHSGEISGGRS